MRDVAQIARGHDVADDMRPEVVVAQSVEGQPMLGEMSFSALDVLTVEYDFEVVLNPWIRSPPTMKRFSTTNRYRQLTTRAVVSSSNSRRMRVSNVSPTSY